ncbi:MAG: hypothetical protein KDC44_11590, partial [Phaeodactylibacter sp.]|nr:hypothetical protein [Phaeodactylibacter sp.]
MATHLPGDQHRLAEMLAQLLAAIHADSEGMPATESRLTSRGFPMEFAYVWPADSFRATTDLLPGGTARQRLIKSLNWTGPFQHSYQ